jgi:hypothetical protein
MNIVVTIFFTCAIITTLQTQTIPATNQSWKEDLQLKFNNHLDLLRTIINQGETLDEIKDFERYFTQLEQWVATTIDQLSSPQDACYQALITKLSTISQLIEAQQHAESSLKELLGNTTTLSYALPRIRLSLLYEINVLLTQNMSSQNAALQAAQKAARCIAEKENISTLENILELDEKTCNESKQALKQKLVYKLEKARKENLELQTDIVQNGQRSRALQQQNKLLKDKVDAVKKIILNDGTVLAPFSEQEQAKRSFIELELTHSTGEDSPKK